MSPGAERDIVAALKCISHNLSKKEEPHWKERRALAWELFKQEVDKAELVPIPGDPLDDQRIAHYARKSFELTDIFLNEEHFKKPTQSTP